MNVVAYKSNDRPMQMDALRNVRANCGSCHYGLLANDRFSPCADVISSDLRRFTEIEADSKADAR